MAKEAVLITGGMGYIGSHVVVELVRNGFEPVILDNLSNSKISTLNNINHITGESVQFIRGDISEVDKLHNIVRRFCVRLCIHLAGLKVPSASFNMTSRYYEQNVYCSITLLKALLKAGVNNIVFSSSASVYGNDNLSPIAENSSPIQCRLMPIPN
jgi:UDP-glucose 4-epimerase